MAIPQLSEEQVETWTVEQKDRWWLANVYRGNVAQLTLRSAVTGFLLGGILCSTNLYIGAKTGWSLGVGITSVILAFAIFRALAKSGLATDITILENNCSQSIATASAYMTGPLISALTAYMLVDGKLIPWYQMVLWLTVCSILGVLFAFPLKRHFINHLQCPFPEGKAAGVVLDTLHHSDASSGVRHARVLLTAAGVTGCIKFLQAEAIQTWIQSRLLQIKAHVYRLPESLDFLIQLPWRWIKKSEPNIGGVSLENLTVSTSVELALIGAGGLMGIRAGLSLMVGAALNYCVLAPWMIAQGQIVPRVSPDGVASYGLKAITLWSLWPGVTCLVVASMIALFASPKMLIEPFVSLFRGGSVAKKDDPMREIELPIWISIVGIPIVSLLAAILANQFFNVNILWCLAGLPLTVALVVVASHSTAITSITPFSATAKVTQLFYGIVQPGNVTTNLATAGITGEVVSNASNLLMDLKPGYMLGAKPRVQAIGHIIGIFSGAIFSVPLFFILFCQRVATEGVESIQSKDFPMPSATVWKAVAEALTKGLDSLPYSVRYAVAAGAIVAVVLEVSRILTRGKFPLQAVPLGLAFVIDFGSSFAMFLGAFLFWCLGVGRISHTSESPESDRDKPKNWWVEYHDPLCAGIIAGAALMGVADAIVAGFFLR